LSNRERWGPRAKPDPLSKFFKDWMEDVGLINIVPINLILTWTNKRVGQDYIGKRLDHFLVKEDLLTLMKEHRSSTLAYGGSYHDIGILERRNEIRTSPIPFKFNPYWLEF
jgi:hypothetical protein